MLLAEINGSFNCFFPEMILQISFQLRSSLIRSFQLQYHKVEHVFGKIAEYKFLYSCRSRPSDTISLKKVAIGQFKLFHAVVF